MVIIQKPNKSLVVMLVALAASYLFGQGLAHAIARGVFDVAGVFWSSQEIISGASWVRRLLGAAVFVTIALSLVKAFMH